jgi:hypothetical protein
VTIEEFERHLVDSGYSADPLTGADSQAYILLKTVTIGGGRCAGQTCAVAILRNSGQPWAPQAAIHVRPHLVPMGQQSSQASPIGVEWQYLSRRFDRAPTSRNLLAHILTVLAEIK